MTFLTLRRVAPFVALAVFPLSVRTQYGLHNSSPHSFAANASWSRQYFAASDGDANGRHGMELWCSNGKRTGTSMVRDIRPGPQGSFPKELTPTAAIPSRTMFFFTANDGHGAAGTGRELWISDGTALGTKRVKDIRPGSLSSNPTDLTFVGSVLYFTANDGRSGRELWKSDGTAIGTVRVKDILVGINSSHPMRLTPFGKELFFTAQTRLGRELWKSDGTALGTVLVKDIFSGPKSSAPADLTVSASLRRPVLYFSAFTDTHGRELWKSDGSSAGTVLVADMRTGSRSSHPTQLTATPGVGLFFSANDGVKGRELWLSKGSSSTTSLTKDINVGKASSRPEEICGVGTNGIFFVADDGGGRELFVSLATTVSKLKDLNPSAGSDPMGLKVVGSRLYFSANDGTNGRELFTSLTTSTSTALVKNINNRPKPGGNRSSYPGFFSCGTPTLFSADDGTGGVELWTTDGTSGGTTSIPIRTDKNALQPTLQAENRRTSQGWFLDLPIYDALPSHIAIYFLGLGSLPPTPAPPFCGVLRAVPLLLFPTLTDARGNAMLSFRVPRGIDGLRVVFQAFTGIKTLAFNPPPLFGFTDSVSVSIEECEIPSGCKFTVPGATYSDEHWTGNLPVDATCTGSPNDYSFQVYRVTGVGPSGPFEILPLGEPIPYSPGNGEDPNSMSIRSQLEELVPALFPSEPGDRIQVRVMRESDGLDCLLYETYC